MILDEETTDSSLQSEVPPRDDNVPPRDNNVPFPNDGIVSDRSDVPPKDDNVPFRNDGIVLNRSNGQDGDSKSDLYFIAKVASFLMFHSNFFILQCALHGLPNFERLCFLKEKRNFHLCCQVIHSFDAQADGELSLEVDHYVVVRQVTILLFSSQTFFTLYTTLPVSRFCLPKFRGIS